MAIFALLAIACDPSAAHLPSATPSMPPAPSVPVASATPATTPVPTPTVVHRSLVPVTDFRAPWTETSADEVAAVLAGASERYDAIEVLEGEKFRVLAALGLGLPGEASRLVTAPDLVTLRADLATSRKRLAFILA